MKLKLLITLFIFDAHVYSMDMSANYKEDFLLYTDDVENEQDFFLDDNSEKINNNEVINLENLSTPMLRENIHHIGYDIIKKHYRSTYSLVEKEIKNLDGKISFLFRDDQKIIDHQIDVLEKEINRYEYYHFYIVFDIVLNNVNLTQQQINCIERIIKTPISDSPINFLTITHKKYLFGLVCSQALSPIIGDKQKLKLINECDLNCTNGYTEHTILLHYFGYFNEVELNIEKGLEFLHKAKSFSFLKHVKLVLFIGDDALFTYKAILKSLEKKVILMPIFTKNFPTHVVFRTSFDNFIHDFFHIRDMLSLNLLQNVYLENPLSDIENNNRITYKLNQISDFCAFINKLEQKIDNNKKTSFNYVFSTLVRDFRPKNKLGYLNEDVTSIFAFYKTQKKHSLSLIKSSFKKCFNNDDINHYYSEYKELGEAMNKHFPQYSNILISKNITFKNIGFNADESGDKIYNAPLAFNLFGLLLEWALEEIIAYSSDF